MQVKEAIERLQKLEAEHPGFELMAYDSQGKQLLPIEFFAWLCTEKQIIAFNTETYSDWME